MACSKEDSWIRHFSVTDPIKHVKGFTLYKITSMVYPKKYPESVTKVVIWKRYNDFKKLHKELRTRHKKLHLPDEFPPFVKAKFFSRFEVDVVEERRRAALTLLEFVAKHSSLFTSDVFVKFFECGYTVDCEDGTVSNSVVRRSASPLHHSRIDPDTGQGTSLGSSDDDRTSFTTDTDSAVSTPYQETERPGGDESPPDISVEEDTWSGQQLKSSLSQTTLSSLASVESLFSRRLQSFKNRFTRSDSASEAKQKESEAVHYWTETQKIVNQAEIKEREGDYQTAFECYKQAIAQLLSGVQNDTDNDRRKLVKERTADYLCKAEFIANHFLSNDTPTKRRKENDLVPLSQLWQPLSDLQFFKVVGVVGKVMLVIDSRTHFLYIIKALIKSAMPVDKNKSCIFPRRIPYMVDLHSIFETDSCIYLVLQYISGGRLWDYVSPFLEKPRDETPARSRRSSNPQPSADQDHISVLSTSDSCPSALNLQVQDCEVRSTLSSPGTSYLDLIRDYTTNRQAEELILSATEESSDLNLYQTTRDITDDSSVTALYQIVSDTLTNLSPEDERKTDNLPTLTASSDNLYRDVLTLVNSEFTLNIEDSVDLDTKDLVEHAQRLLQSVDATLLESKSVISRVELGQLTTTSTTTTEQTTPVRLAVDSDRFNREFDRLSVASNHSNRSLDLTRLAPHISSKGSSPPSSIGPEAPPQWCQLEVNGVGLAEDNVRRWGAQLLVALHALHQTGVSCLDLSFDNILVCGSAVRLTYFCSVPGVEPRLNQLACQQLFTAPELSSIFPPSPAADWWSLGSILYHLLTGQSLSLFYPSGIYCHTIVYIPDTISVEARSLLKELLRYDPSERLGSGLLGVEEIKSHPFFEDVQWDQVHDEGLSPV